MQRSSLILPFLLCLNTVFAQQVAVKKVEIAGQKIVVHYDLEDANPNNEYQIFLYSSQNSFSTALTRVSGDVGNEVKPGHNRKIVWDVTEEIGPYRGQLALEIRGNLYAPFVKLQNFDTDRTYKRGKTYEVTWKPNGSNPIHIELLKDAQRVGGKMNEPNNGITRFEIPAKVKPGKGYQIRFTDSRNSNDVIHTEYFQVKPKVPLLVKVVPLLGIGGAAVFLSGSEGGPGGNDDVIAAPRHPSEN